MRIATFAVFGLSILGLWSFLPLKDPPSYFLFADTRSLYFIPNIMDVSSNLAFLAVGIVGLYVVWVGRESFSKEKRVMVSALAISMIFTAIGSAYFHWSPQPETLVWDRIPMTLAFAAILGLVIEDRISQKWASYIFFLLVPLGFLSVYGYSKEWFSLRPYIILQFGTLGFLLLTIFTSKPRMIANKVWGMSLGLYVAAKACEMADSPIYELSGFISGHTVKHLLAAASVWKLVHSFSAPHAPHENSGKSPLTRPCTAV